jgi:hypothetical protein
MAPEGAGCILNGAIHSNTSLARTVNAYDSETFRLATVYRLTVMWKRVVCSIGISAGFPPLAMQST